MSKYRTITIHNRFHATAVHFRVTLTGGQGTIPEKTVERLDARLCGSRNHGCSCPGLSVEVEAPKDLEIERDDFGGFTVRLVP